MLHIEPRIRVLDSLERVAVRMSGSKSFSFTFFEDQDSLDFVFMLFYATCSFVNALSDAHIHLGCILGTFLNASCITQVFIVPYTPQILTFGCFLSLQRSCGPHVFHILLLLENIATTQHLLIVDLLGLRKVCNHSF